MGITEESRAFQAALEGGGLEGLRACPKADLHNHAILGGDRSFLETWSGRAIPVLDRKLATMDEMHAWVETHVGRPFADSGGRLKAFEATLIQARADGITRLEVGDDIWAITLFENSAERLTGELRALHTRVVPDLEWIPQLGMSRHCRIEALTAWLEPFLDLGFYETLDLSGDEFAQPIENFAPFFARAKKAGFRLKAHVGEWGDAASVQRAVEVLDLDEVQHGIAAADSPPVMRFLASHKIRLNICPTSNLMLSRVDSLAQHPIRKLFDAGVRVTINTDDVLVFGASVSQEFLSLFEAGVFTAAELDQIRLNGLTD
ncbi:MAG: adenosine deaminase [Alphaproteobacteria bacterium]